MQSSKSKSLVQWLSAAVIIACLIVLFRIIPVGTGIDKLQTYLASMGILGILIYVGIYVVAAILLIPGSALTLLAGVLYGPIVGTLVVSIGATIGAAGAYVLGRYAFRGSVERATKGKPKFAAIDRAIGKNGPKIVALLRLSPVVPFNLSNYFFGLTSIGFWQYTLVSWVFMLPGTLLYVYLGYAASQAAGSGKSSSVLHWVLVGVGLALILIVTVYITRLAKKALASEEGVTDMTGNTATASAPHATWKRPIILALAAGLMLTLTACSWVNRNVLSGIFGPPPVKLVNKFKSNPHGPQFSNALFNKVVSRYVHKGGWVDYKGLAAHPQNLNAYLAALAKAPFAALGRNNKLALLINAYNAFTLHLMLKYYPHIKSIMDIPSSARWVYVHWNIGGKLYSLDQIELMLRKDFADPRIHFCINCASIGCPPLRQDAYEAATINAQLQSQAELVNNTPRWVRLSANGKTLHLTRIYDWYSGDFTQAAGSVMKFVARFNKQVAAELTAGHPPTIVYKSYDWNMDNITNRPS